MNSYIHLIENKEEFDNATNIIIPNVTFIENLNMIKYNAYNAKNIKQTPLSFKFLTDGTFNIETIGSVSSGGLYFSFTYKLIRNNIVYNTYNTTIPLHIDVLAGDIVTLEKRNYITKFYLDEYNRAFFSGTAKCIMYGNFESLINTNYKTSTNNIISESKFDRMFENYYCMDIDVNNFTFGKISSSELSCNAMFKNCTSLTATPILTFTTIEIGAFNNMFEGCLNLKEVSALFTTDITNTDEYTKDWLKNVAPYGLFNKNKDATWNNIGPNGVPQNWMINDKYIDY